VRVLDNLSTGKVENLADSIVYSNLGAARSWRMFSIEPVVRWSRT
jgi:hypothetical protein